VFHKFEGDVYYFEAMANKVYKFSSDGYETAYEWDTGVQIIDPKELTNEYYTTNEGWRVLIEKQEMGEVPFVFGMQSQSKNYYYALVIPKRNFKHLFYDKHTGESLFFERTSEGIELNLIHMTEDYAIGFIKDIDTSGLQKVVSAKDAELLKARKDDDNWWLVKYTFK
jgi:hypothetical protein